MQASATDGPPSPPSAGGQWPKTPWSTVRRARDGTEADRRAARDQLFELYYVPVRRFFGRALAIEDGAADDVAHDLFVRLLEKDFLEGLRHETSLRAFLKLACRRQCANWRRGEAASRRALRNLAVNVGAPGEGPLDALDEELRHFYVEEAVRRLREDLVRRGKNEMLAIFEARTRFDGSRPEEYDALAGRFGLRIYDVRNRLAAAREVFRRELMRIARERAEDPREELRELGLLKLVEE